MQPTEVSVYLTDQIKVSQVPDAALNKSLQFVSWLLFSTNCFCYMLFYCTSTIGCFNANTVARATLLRPPTKLNLQKEKKTLALTVCRNLELQP